MSTVINLSFYKGGVGKSTIAHNLAVAFRQAKIIDLDNNKTLTKSNMIRSEFGLSSFDIQAIENSDKLLDFIKQENRNEKSLIIIDSGGYDVSKGRVALSLADINISPVSDSIYDLFGLEETEKALREISEIMGETVKTHIVFNKISPNSRSFDSLKEYVSSSEHFVLFDTILRNRSAFKKSLDSGKGVVEFQSKGKASEEFLSLLKEIKEKIDI